MGIPVQPGRRGPLGRVAGAAALAFVTLSPGAAVVAPRPPSVAGAAPESLVASAAGALTAHASPAATPPRPPATALATAPSEVPGGEPARRRPPAPETRPGAASAWRLSGGPPVTVRVGSEVLHAAPAHLERDALAGVEAGDTLHLALPEIGELDVVIQRRSEPAPGIRVLQGHLAEPEAEHPVSLTLGPARAFAHVATPTGTWIGEFEGTRGFVLPDEFEDRLVDHSVSDARIPPGDRP